MENLVQIESFNCLLIVRDAKTKKYALLRVSRREVMTVTARSDLCPIRVQWLQAVFMRLLVF